MKTKTIYHVNWVCPKCKKIYPADDWAKEERKKILTDFAEKIDNEMKLLTQKNKVSGNYRRANNDFRVIIANQLKEATE